MKRLKKFSIILAMSLFLNSAYANNCQENDGIDVHGYASVKAEADTAVLSFSAVGKHKKAKEARSIAEKQTLGLYNAAQKLGLDKESFKSSSIVLYPKYTYDKNGKAHFSEYQANRDITIRVKDFALIDELTTAAVDSGISNINGFSYELSNKDDYKIKADNLAIKDAMSQAQRLADGFNVKIKKACSIRFSNNYNARVMPMMKMARLDAQSNDVEEHADYTPENIVIESNVDARFTIE